MLVSLPPSSCTWSCSPSSRPWILSQNGSYRKWTLKIAHTFSRRQLGRLLMTVCHDSLSITEDVERPWTSKIGEGLNKPSINKFLQVVLFSPQIPGNTGCIARTCAATSVGLHLVEPLGFQIDDTKLKRAGLDYWPYVLVKVHQSWCAFMDYLRQQEGDKRLIAFTKRGDCLYTDKAYRSGDWLVFGSETTGLSTEAIRDCTDAENFGGGKVRIPMIETHVRSLNLSVSAGIGVYEALRQLNALENLGAENSYDQLEEEPLMKFADV